MHSSPSTTQSEVRSACGSARAMPVKRPPRSTPRRLVSDASPPSSRAISAVAVPLHLVQPAAAGRQRVGRRRQHRRIAGRRRRPRRFGAVVLLDHQPVLLVAAQPRRYQRPQPLYALAGQQHGEAAVALALDQLVAAVIPDLHRSGAVFALGDHPREAGVLHRMVLRVHGQVTLAGIEREPLGERPRGQRASHLQPQVVVKPAGVVALDHEQRAAVAAAVAFVGGRLRRLSRPALAAVLVERHQS